MTIVGLWLAIVGYGIAFAGMSTLGGAQCSIVDAFRGRCGPGSATRSAATPQSGTTVLARQQAQQAQQAGMIGTQPIRQQVA